MPIIEVNHVTREYRLSQLHSLKTTALNQWRRFTGQPLEECAPFKALDDVSFSVEQGEVVGIIGTNGAGKTGNWCLTQWTPLLFRNLEIVQVIIAQFLTANRGDPA